MPSQTTPRKTKVMHVVQFMGYGGMEGRIRRLAEGLDPERYEIHIVTVKEPPGGSFALPARVRHTFFPIPPGWHLGRLLKLALFIRRSGADIVHTHNWGTMFYGVVAGKLALRPRVVHGEHGLNVEDLGAKRGTRAWAQGLLARWADLLVPVNAVIAGHLAQTWKAPASRMRVIVNGVDVERFRPGRIPPPGEFTVGTVARLEAVKNLPCLLEAARILKDAGDPVQVLLVGEGPLRAALEKQVEEAGLASQVRFAGETADVQLCYGRFSVMVNSSVYEGMSNTLLEAMACGLPLVASRVAGNSLWLREGENALFFASGDAQALAACIRALRDDPERRDAMGRRNRERAEREFDNRGFIAAYRAAYQDLLGRD